MEGNELNIAFQIVILILQNHIQRNKLYHGIYLQTFSQYWEQKVIIFVDMLLESKRMCVHIQDTVLESTRLDNTIHVESSIKACRPHQP